MDSLLANYASSDDEEKQENYVQSSSFSSKPISSSSSSYSSLLSSLPNPKSQSKPLINEDEDDNPKVSIFSSIPKPKTQSQQKPISDSSSNPPKRIVQFKPPINPKYDFDEEDEEEEEKKKERKRQKESESMSQSSSVKSFLSSIPAPKNSSNFGTLPSASGSGRKSIIGIETTPVNSSVGADNDQTADTNESDYDQNDGYHGGYESGITHDAMGQHVADASYESYSSYGNYGDSYYEQYGNNWGDGSSLETATPEITWPSGSGNLRVPGKKRGKNEIPTEIIEVKQDELTKNRPREDQVKLTGIAFGPSYQPASTKGKPSKLHKRKHQIGSLYFDMKQKETELAERRAKGFLTKAQTHAKYGW